MRRSRDVIAMVGGILSVISLFEGHIIFLVSGWTQGLTPWRLLFLLSLVVLLAWCIDRSTCWLRARFSASENTVSKLVGLAELQEEIANLVSREDALGRSIQEIEARLN